MTELTTAADLAGDILAMTASGDFGAQPTRLRRFYASLGFTPNRGRNKQWATREAMIRSPRSC